MRKATAFSAQEATSDVAKTATIRPERDVHAWRQGKISIGDGLGRAHLLNILPDTEPVVVNITNFVAVTHARYKQFQECTEVAACYDPEGLARYKAGDTALNQNVLDNTFRTHRI